MIGWICVSNILKSMVGDISGPITPWAMLRAAYIARSALPRLFFVVITETTVIRIGEYYAKVVVRITHRCFLLNEIERRIVTVCISLIENNYFCFRKIKYHMPLCTEVFQAPYQILKTWRTLWYKDQIVGIKEIRNFLATDIYTFSVSR